MTDRPWAHGSAEVYGIVECVSHPEAVGPNDPSVTTKASIQAISALAEAVLAPNANPVDQHGISRSQLDELAATGAFGLPFDPQLGGGGADPAEVREAVELIAGACGTTWFCYAQHRSPTTNLMRSQNRGLRDQWLPSLVAGEAIAGIAFAHLRRPRQTFWISEHPGGWMLDGALDWVTTWPLCDVVLVQGYLRAGSAPAETRGGAGAGAEAEIISVLIEPPPVDLEYEDRTEIPGLIAGPDLALAAMAGTHTWPVRFDNYFVPDAAFVSRQPAQKWALDNSLVAADANPACFGIARACVNDLGVVAQISGQQPAIAAAAALRDELIGLRQTAYRLADEAAADREVAIATLDERTRLRSQALDLAVRCSTALIVASGGRALTMSQDAQRHAREALFLMVQGQTAELRRDSLALLSSGTR